MLDESLLFISHLIHKAILAETAGFWEEPRLLNGTCLPWCPEQKRAFGDREGMKMAWQVQKGRLGVFV